MKKYLLIFVFALVLTPYVKAQNVSEVFNENKCTWFGLDFSEIGLIGPGGFNDLDAIKNRYFDSWNYLFISEPEKYDVGEAFRKDQVNDFLDVVEERNKMPEIDELLIEGLDYSISKEKVQSMIKEYNTGDLEGLGIVFIMETFNKIAEEGTMWVTLFDIQSKKALITKHMKGRPGGFGFRNYWAKSYYNVLIEVEKKQYKKWKKEFDN